MRFPVAFLAGALVLALAVGSHAAAETPTPTATVLSSGTPATTDATAIPSAASATPGPTGSPVPSPIVDTTPLSGEGTMLFNITLHRIVRDGRTLDIPEGTKLIARTVAGACAETPINVSAINSDAAVTFVRLEVPGSECT